MIFLFIYVAIFLLAFYTSYKYDLSGGRIFILSILPTLLLSIFASLQAFYSSFSIIQFLSILLSMPFIYYIMVFPPLIISATMLVYIEKHYSHPFKIFILQGAIIGGLNMLIYISFLTNPIKLLVFVSTAIILGAISTYILHRFIRIGIQNDH